jgi:SAM-dependent methyltransferase
MDWKRWHEQYDQSDSPLARRLRNVQGRIRDALDQCPPGPLTVISLCAGQGRDLLGALHDHPRRDDVRARLVELDPELAAAARQTARAAGLDQVDVVTGDATLTDHYLDLAPAHLVLMCGVFGNLTDDDIERAIGRCPQLCRPGGRVIWTRHRKAPDRIPVIGEWFAKQGFTLQWLTDPDIMQAVGVHRFEGPAQPLEPGASMFTFVGSDALRP